MDGSTTRRWFFGAAALAGGSIPPAVAAASRGSTPGGDLNLQTADRTDLATGVGARLIGFDFRTVAAKLTDTLATADRGVSTAGGAAENAAVINALIDETHGATGSLEVSKGLYNVTQIAFPPAGDFRGEPFRLLGRGTGEPYVADAQQGGTLLNGVDATAPTVKVNHAGAVKGAGSIEFGQMRVAGTQNAGVAALRIDGLLGLNHFHDFSVKQNGAGDGIQMGWFGGSVMDRFMVVGRTLGSVGRTGTGVSWTPDHDIGLGEVSHGTARAFQLGWRIGNADGNRLLAHKMSMCEASFCADGIIATTQVEGLHIDQAYIEGCPGTGIEDNGRATLITAPYIVLEFKTGIEFQGIGGVAIGGVLGLATTGSTGIVVGAGSGGVSVFGTQVVWGGGTAGTNVGHGVHIEAQANPVVNLFVDYRGDWKGTGSTARLLDESHSVEHGGAAAGNGSGAIGWLSRQTEEGEPLPCLSRGAINLKVDAAVLDAADINASSELTISPASVQYLSVATPRNIARIRSPNLPDKTGWLIIERGNVTFTPSASYMGGLSVPEVFGSGEVGAVQYQTVPGSNGKVWITNVYRQGPHAYTVVELPPAGMAGAGHRAFVTDALAPTFGAAVAGRGRVATPVYSDGTVWRVG